MGKTEIADLVRPLMRARYDMVECRPPFLPERGMRHIGPAGGYGLSTQGAEAVL